MQTLAMPAAAESWSLTSLREKLIKIGAKVVSDGRYVMFQMAEVAVPRQMLHDILRLIARLRAPPAPSMRGAGIGIDRRRRQRCGLIKAKRVPAPRGEQPIVAGAAPRWWTGSGVILGVPVDLSAPGMAVTPAILSRTICRRLFRHLEDRSQQTWADLLLRRSLDNLLLKRGRVNWSEYSLYYLLAEHDKVLFDYHFLPSSEDAARLHCQSNVWTKAQFAGWDPKYCFDRNTAGLFLIVQSSSTISFELICRRLNPYLPITQPVTASLTHRLRSLWEDIRTVDGLFSSASRRAKGNRTPSPTP
jgi:hypothetical protein